ncbi:MAG: DUF3095 domain-containing protein [Fulvimarina manganoxydans]|uniref:DUF3095 domain-containing protein n=1 Tax=Fulvimarina manganoxydans TaxID=937218 RepID=UPI0023527EA6|nr:DUF3095 domain-containing protein [Fulvimarina manganoxydans]MCK5934657.1 DUF3095 domain-containing protein [Fulvimarina manganoxydans]
MAADTSHELTLTENSSNPIGQRPDRRKADYCGLDLFEALPAISNFEALRSADIYTPLPDDWMVGVADIRGSTEVIASGQYKAVNTVAAALIAAVSNALPDRAFPSVFAGDGAGFALPPDEAEKGREALRAVAGWARDAFGFDLRIAAVEIGALRAAGRDVRVARFAASDDVTYTMFSGGGLALAEALMKAGHNSLDPHGPDKARPDLTGLSCRFADVPAKNGTILSVIVLPTADTDDAGFEALVSKILAIAKSDEADAPPVSDETLKQRWPPSGLEIEAHTVAASRRLPHWVALGFVAIRTLVAHGIFKRARPLGGFDPKRYREQLVRNSDFRKFDDGLLLTLDCSTETADKIEAAIEAGRMAGTARGGVHRQSSALVTCFVPTPSRSDHVHFVDGAMGGYTLAARAAFEKAEKALRPESVDSRLREAETG